VEAAVEFCGEQHDIAPLLADADVFVLASRTEGLPIALLEAMAASLPVIVTSVGGMSEVLELCKCGSLVPPGQPEAFAAEIVRLAGARERLSDLGERSRRCYEQHFDPKQMTSQYLQLYQNLQSA
jgi:L-malate glycosyltransferase